MLKTNLTDNTLDVAIGGQTVFEAWVEDENGNILPIKNKAGAYISTTRYNYSPFYRDEEYTYLSNNKVRITHNLKSASKENYTTKLVYYDGEKIALSENINVHVTNFTPDDTGE